MFSCVRTSYNLCAHAHAHSLEGTLMAIYFSTSKEVSWHMETSFLLLLLHKSSHKIFVDILRYISTMMSNHKTEKVCQQILKTCFHLTYQKRDSTLPEESQPEQSWHLLPGNIHRTRCRICQPWTQFHQQWRGSWRRRRRWPIRSHHPVELECNDWRCRWKWSIHQKRDAVSSAQTQSVHPCLCLRKWSPK